MCYYNKILQIQDQIFLAVAGSFLTKLFARFEYKFLNNSNITR